MTVVAGTGGETEAPRVLMLVDDGADRRFLDRRLPRGLVVGTRDAARPDALDGVEFDLCLLDRAALAAHGEALARRKAEATPEFLPALLVAGMTDGPVGGLNGPVDEVVTEPVARGELRLRVENLLARRRLSRDGDDPRRSTGTDSDPPGSGPRADAGASDDAAGVAAGADGADGTAGAGSRPDGRDRESALRARNERLERFAAVLAHDLHNPIEGARGHVELAAERCECDRTARHLDGVRETLDRMDDVVDDARSLARRDPRVTDPEPVDLSTVAAAAWRTVDAGAATLGQAGDLGTVEGDRSQIRRLLENLFSNGVEHGATGEERGSTGEGRGSTGEGRAPSDDGDRPWARTAGTAGGTAEGTAPAPGDATETASADGGTPGPSPGAGDATGSDGSDAAGSDGGDAVALRVGRTDAGFFVEDDGPGVPPDRRDDVFDPGVSGAGGTGLGLAIVADVAAAHGWTVSVTEGELGGARFEFDTGD